MPQMEYRCARLFGSDFCLGVKISVPKFPVEFHDNAHPAADPLRLDTNDVA